MKGCVYAPNGETTVEGAVVYVPGTSGAKSRGAATPEPAIVSTTSGADGSFTLTGVPAGSQTLKIAKGSWIKAFNINVAADKETMAPSADTTLPIDDSGDSKVLKMAVITGNWDRMQDVLAKLGMGELDTATNQLKLGTEKFDLYDGDESLSGKTGPDGAYKTAIELLNNPAEMAKYDVIFINCGAWVNDDFSSGSTISNNVKSYVSNGGSLYVTDLSYDVVEQTFPDAIDFMGSDSTSAGQAEDMGAADVGDTDITCDASIQDPALKSWLAKNYAGALNGDGTITIRGFLGGWAVMNSVPASTKTWIQGNISYGSYGSEALSASKGRSHTLRSTSSTRNRDSAVKPLTVTFKYGSGRVLFTSYHTEEESPSPNLTPQECVLTYLVFEITAL
ncbi:MAG: hypothetical protein ABFD83_12705 [Armatimonadota bacterium]